MIDILFGSFLFYSIIGCGSVGNDLRTFAGPHIFFYPSFQVELESKGVLENSLPVGEWEYKSQKDTFSIVWQELKDERYRFIIPEGFLLFEKSDGYFEFRDSVNREILMFELIEQNFSSELMKDSLVVGEINNLYLQTKSLAHFLEVVPVNWCVSKFSDKSTISTAIFNWKNQKNEVQTRALVGASIKDDLFFLINYQSKRLSPFESKIIFSEIFSRAKLNERFIIPPMEDFESVRALVE